MNTFNIVSRMDMLSKGLEEAIANALKREGWIRAEEPELVISIGGDGTMLEAFHTYNKTLDKTSFVGLHSGHLGFYADWKQSELDQLVERIAFGQPSMYSLYPLVEVTGESGERYLALNEMTIKNKMKTFISSVYINGDKFEDFRGDGLCVSTPSGSTAYNRGLGGAIIHPSLQAIQLAEIASINNKVFRTIGSSILLPRHHKLEVEGDFTDAIITIDHMSMNASSNKYTFRVADQGIRFARYKDFGFWDRVKDSFI